MGLVNFGVFKAPRYDFVNLVMIVRNNLGKMSTINIVKRVYNSKSHFMLRLWKNEES